MYYNNEPVPDSIPNTTTQKDISTYKCWVWDDIYWRKLSGNCHKRDMLSGFGRESLRDPIYLTKFCLFLPKLYIEGVLLPHKNNILKGVTLLFG